MTEDQMIEDARTTLMAGLLAVTPPRPTPRDTTELPLEMDDVIELIFHQVDHFIQAGREEAARRFLREVAVPVFEKHAEKDGEGSAWLAERFDELADDPDLERIVAAERVILN